VRGFRVSLEDVEASLLAHPLVREACVTARTEADGEACLVAREGQGGYVRRESPLNSQPHPSTPNPSP